MADAGCDGRGYENGAGGTGIVRALNSAMTRSGITPNVIGHINASGKSTLRDDRRSPAPLMAFVASAFAVDKLPIATIQPAPIASPMRDASIAAATASSKR